jgi:general stress protein 26
MTSRASKATVLEFVRGHSVAAMASVSPAGVPQTAVVGFVATDAFELFFDTVESTRKAANLRRNPSIAFTIGGFGPGDERTVQFQGIADSPSGAELERLKELYFRRFPDGRDRLSWPGLIYLRARPTWVRYSDFGRAPPEIVELDF